MKTDIFIKLLKSLVVSLLVFLVLGCATTPDESVVEEPTEPEFRKPLINLGSIRQVTNNPEDDGRPSYSPDGTKIAFHSKRKGKYRKRKKNRDIWVIGVDGSSPKQLTTTEADDFNPVFSPDGELIAYVSEADGTQDIWIMNADGKGKKNLTADPGRESYPSWSPDGKSIIYSAFSEESGDADLWTIRPDSGEKRKLTNFPGNEIFPTWHKDGKNIAFASDKDGKLDIYITDVESSKVQRLIETSHHKSRPSFSPDGTMIAYTAWENGAVISPHIWVANANGTDPYQITHDARNTHSAWSPTGRQIAFHSDYDENWDIWIAEVPEEVLNRAHFAFIGVIRGRDDKDVITLDNGDTLTGRVLDEKITLHTPYTRTDFPTKYVASMDVSSGEMFLINGDVLKGYILNDAIRFSIEAGQIFDIRREKIRTIAFGVRPEEPKTFPKGDKIFLRNRDCLTGEVSPPPSLITSAAGKIDIVRENLKAIQFLEDSDEDVQLVFKNGDTLKGVIGDEDIVFRPFYGHPVNIYKGKISEIIFKD